MKMRLSACGYFLVLFSAIACTQSYKLLLMFPVASSSHFILGTSLAKGFANAGHDVTVVTPYEDKNAPSGTYRQIVVSEIEQAFRRKNVNMFGQKSILVFFNTFWTMMNEITLAIHTNPEIQQMIKNKETFDAVIMTELQLDSLRMGSNSWVNKLVGNPAPLSYIPEVHTSYQSRMTFFQRLGNAFSYCLLWFIGEFWMAPSQKEFLERFYPDAPSIDDLRNNVSLVLLNSNLATTAPVPIVPNMIPIGGYHVQPPKPLPNDLKQYLDNAKEGVVYFSMGSVLNTTNIPKEKIDVLLNTFKQVKQKVLWKFNEDLPEKSANVKIETWLPQQSVLAHPNVKLFITHSGLLSTTETIYHGKPVLAMPIFGDQPSNAKQMQNNGFGLIQDFDGLLTNPKGFLEKIEELLNNPYYYENAQRCAKIFHDLPMKPMETANFWLEYVIRHKGAPHLRVVGAELPWYKLYLVDVWAFLMLSVVLICKTIKIAYNKFMCRKNQQEKLKQN